MWRGVEAGDVEDGVGRETRWRLRQCGIFRSPLLDMKKGLWVPSVQGEHHPGNRWPCSHIHAPD